MQYNKKQVFNVQLDAIETYSSKAVQKNIADDARALIANEGLSHDDVIKEISILPTIRNLTVTIPLRGDIAGRQHYYIGDVLISRRWLSYFLEVDDDGYPRRPPRMLNNVRMLDLYLKVKAAQRGTIV